MSQSNNNHRDRERCAPVCGCVSHHTFQISAHRSFKQICLYFYWTWMWVPSAVTVYLFMSKHVRVEGVLCCKHWRDEANLLKQAVMHLVHTAHRALTQTPWCYTQVWSISDLKRGAQRGPRWFVQEHFPLLPSHASPMYKYILLQGETFKLV